MIYLDIHENMVIKVLYSNGELKIFDIGIREDGKMKYISKQIDKNNSLSIEEKETLKQEEFLNLVDGETLNKSLDNAKRHFQI